MHSTPKMRTLFRFQFNCANRYYRLCNLDTRIANPDQLLTQDVDKFCTSLADLYAALRFQQ